MHAQSIPGPTPLPLLGNLLDVERDLVATFTRHWRAHGDVFRLDFGPQPIVVVVDPDDVAHVLHDRAQCYGREPYRRLDGITGEGLLVAEGAGWKRNRRILQPLFTKRAVHDLVPDLVASADELLDRWSGQSHIEDLTTEMGWVTLRAITRTLFAWDVRDELDGFCADVGILAESVNAKLFLPEVVGRLPLPMNRRYATASGRIQDAVEALIRRRDGQPAGTDLLSRLRDARDPETDAALSFEEVRDELITLFVAGHETTALTLTWTLCRLSQHPEWMRRVTDEVRAVDLADPMALRQLPALGQVVQEVLRLHPSVWVYPRHVRSADTLPSGRRIPAGALVLLSPYLTHRHPGHWENPLGFDPDRFGPDAARRHPCAYFPFGRASRMCIGRELALLEAMVITARILQHVQPSLAVEVRPSAQGTLRPAEAVPMNLAPVGSA